MRARKITHPLRIHFIGQGEDDIAGDNVEKVLSLGIPLIEKVPPHGRPLAIVGGGPSFLNHLDELREWSDIWAINGVGRVLRENGIESTAVTVDPNPDQWKHFDGIGEGLFASRCIDRIFAMYRGRCRMFHMENGGATTATRLHYPAFLLGYGELHYFGCECTYETDTHGYDYTDPGPELVIEAGGKRYPTKPYMVMQTEYLCRIMREFPEVFIDRSGGLLTAMREHFYTWGIVEAADELKPFLEPFLIEGNDGD